MNGPQRNILWIGVIIVVVFLFSDQNFRNQIFKRGTANAAPKTTSYTLAQILTVPATTSTGTTQATLV
jgi:hypothetical protein